jgi:cytochrome c553
MKAMIRFAMILAVAQSAEPADIEAGKRIASTVCAACHGVTGISVSDTVPNLAGQRARYTEAQLKFFKDGTRKEPGAVSRAAIMNAIASQLSAEEIVNVAAYFESQPGGAPGTKSALLPNIATTKVAFPQDYRQSFTKYLAINFPAAKEVRYYYANAAALTAAKGGKPLPDGSVLFAEVYSAKLDANSNPTRTPTAFTFRTNCCDTRRWSVNLVGGTTSLNSSATKTGITRSSPPPNSISKASIRPNA